MPRDILLCDLDAFFASVEQCDRTELVGLPVIVGGSPEARGVVASCSYEARRFGVRSAMPVRRALRLCPQAVLLPPDLPRYRRASEEVFALFRQYAEAVEEVSIDEAYLAVPPGKGVHIAQELRRRVREDLGLPLSVGVSANKLLAKIACELAKPDGLKELWPEDVPFVLWPLDVSVLPGVGQKTRKRLDEMGIRSVGDLAARREETLASALGSLGGTLWRYAHGLDDRELETAREEKSLGAETTFPRDVRDPEEALAALAALSEDVGWRLRQKGLLARTVTVKIRYADHATVTRSATLPRPVRTDGAVWRAAKELFLCHAGHGPWRLVGVQVANLVDADWRQLSLLEDRGREIREEKLAAVLDGLKSRYGKDAVRRARALAGDKGDKKPR
ncbi:MAG: DNA polymerase IV [Clostridia bacterium]|nr:DNA polymerase IV [Clostridia bacterium]